jgi:sporulation protein YlmC with PRC-barrel domain
MLLNSSKLVGCPVLSLHLGGPIGRVTGELVDPNDLTIIALNVDGPQTGDGDHGDILDVRNIREFSNIGMIVDSIDELVSKGDVVRFDKIIDLNFSIIGLNVKTKKGVKLGKVVDYTFDPETMQIMQLIVKRPFIKAFLDPELIIGRSQIKEVNDYEIIVREEEEKIKKESGKKDFVPNFINPFREGKFATNEATVEEDK